jgi:hypothetical protein
MEHYDPRSFKGKNNKHKDKLVFGREKLNTEAILTGEKLQKKIPFAKAETSYLEREEKQRICSLE